MRTLYNPRFVGLVVLVGLVCLAIGQARLIYDAAHALHPAWHPFWIAMLAAGFELVIIGCAMAGSITGSDKLVWGELFVISVSIAAGVIVGMTSHEIDDVARWALVVALGVVPIQYAIAVRAGHALTEKFGDPQPTNDPTPTEQDPDPALAFVWPTMSDPLPPAQQPAPAMAADILALVDDGRPLAGETLDRWEDPADDEPDQTIAADLAAYVQLALQRKTRKQIAEALGVTPRTVTRNLSKAREQGLLPPLAGAAPAG